MLWFNKGEANFCSGGRGFQYILCCGSTSDVNNFNSIPEAFQYILCCGSTGTSYTETNMESRISIHLMLWFNLKVWLTNIHFQRISIHLMLWFNCTHRRMGTSLSKFQYILCCGSTLIYEQ